ncbi:ester cyclase [Steroidobacter sp. S1-65]|uniref:Ester cyclase n=1 Tax=Steroidobacter gossypii TaxID=2805490 RepID=A0ABS1X3P5_9GAMM|nr:nuclear transport factor 2 family protein [Steroidobacter gossypii]MBM0107844.1 ester cyclase [Steroidobacter gossypii]
MARKDAVAIVETFWREVWMRPQNPDAIDRLVAEDFVITSAGQQIHGRAAFKQWVIEFQSKLLELEFEVIETFQNEAGDRVASRWRVTGRNNGILGTEPDGQPISMVGTAVLAVREDGVLAHNWVERNAWEIYSQLLLKQSEQGVATRQPNSSGGERRDARRS